MSEWREADAAYRETGKKEHAVWRFEAMRSKDMTDSDFVRAFDTHEGRAEDDRIRRKKLARKFGLEFGPSGEKNGEK